MENDQGRCDRLTQEIERLRTRIRQLEQTSRKRGTSVHVEGREAEEKCLESLPGPLDNTERIVFEDLFDLKDIQRLQDQFAEAAGVASIITHTDGTPITQPSNFCRLCRDIIRQTDKGLSNCFKSDTTIGRFHPEGPVVLPCLSGGLWDAGAAISVEGRHIANWLIGQVRDETQTEANIRTYAREIGADEEAVVTAFHEVPAMSRTRFEKIAEVLFTLANQLSNSAFQNVQQARVIAARIKAEEARALLEKGIAQAAEAVVMTSPEGTIQYVNPAFERITGYTKNEVLGENPRILKSGRHDEDFYRVIWKTITSGQTWTGEFVNRRKHGEVYYEKATISPVLNDEGKILNYIAVKEDITSRKEAEESLLESEERFRALFQQAGGYCMILDPNTADGIPVIVDANDAACAAHGYAYEEFVGRPVADVDDEDGKRLVRARTREIMTGKPFYVENVHVRKDGTSFPVAVNAKRIDIGNGPPLILTTEYDITERKASEEKLRTYQYYLEKAQEIGRIGTWKLDIQANVLKWTDENYRVFGVPLGTELTYEIFLNCVHPEDRAFVDEKWRAAMHHEPYDIEHRLLVDGKVKWVREKAEVEFNEQGQAVKAIGFTQDITDRVLAEMKKEVVETQFKAIFNESFQFALILDTEGKILEMNQLCHTVCGPLADDSLGRPFWEAAWWNQFPHVQKQTKLAIRKAREGHSSTDEIIFVDKDRNIHHGMRAFSPIHDQNDELSFISVVGVDISNRKQVEQELRRNREFLSTIYENSDVGIFVVKVDSPGTYTYEGINTAHEKLFGVRNRDIIGKTPKDLEPIFGIEAIDFVHTIYDECVSSRRPCEYEHEVAVEGKHQWWLSRLTPLLDRNGDVYRIIGSAMNIDQRKRAEQQVLNHQIQLKSLASELVLAEEQERTRIAEHLHDDICQTLAYAKMKLQVINASLEDQTKAEDLTDLCELLTSMMKDVRTLTFELSSPVLSEFGLEAAIRHWLKEQVQEKYDIKTEMTDDGQNKPLTEDVQALLFRSVRELLTNVIKHSQATKVKVRVGRDRDQIVISLQDDGIGFAPEKVVVGKGTGGFGLFSIRERLSQFGGALKIESEPGQGCGSVLRAPLLVE